MKSPPLSIIKIYSFPLAVMKKIFNSILSLTKSVFSAIVIMNIESRNR